MANNPGVVKEYPTEFLMPDGQVIKVDETPGLKIFFDQTVSVASTREKNKLYSNIAERDTKIDTLTKELNTVKTELGDTTKDLQDTMSQLQNNNQDQQRLQQQLNDVNKANPVTMDDVRKLISNEFLSKIPGDTAAALGPIKDQLDKLNESRLLEFRLKRIAEEGDTIIPELVNGNTEEEIENSITFSKNIRKAYGVAASQQQSNQSVSNQSPSNQSNSMDQNNQQQQQQQQQAQRPPAALPKPGASDDSSLPDIGSMSHEEFAAKRKELRQALSGAYSQPGQ